MADYTRSTRDNRSSYPENAVAAHEWALYEPLLTALQLRERFLWGIPLISSSPDPRTRVPAVMSDELLKDMILRAVSLIQLETSIDIFPVKREEKMPFDKQEILDLGYIRMNYRPIRSVDKLSIAPGNSRDLTVIDPGWVSKEGFAKGEIRIVTPIDTISSMGYVSANAGVGQGSAFVGIMSGGLGWIPSFWKIEYTTGFDDGQIPRPMNELIGCAAAIEVLSLLGTTNRSNSISANIDGMGQSVSTAGPQVYDGRIKVLAEKKTQLSKLFRARFGNKFAIGNI